MERYDTWGSFREVLENIVEYEVSPAVWRLLEKVLFWSAVHEPYSSGDVVFALNALDEIMKEWGRK